MDGCFYDANSIPFLLFNSFCLQVSNFYTILLYFLSYIETFQIFDRKFEFSKLDNLQSNIWRREFHGLSNKPNQISKL